MGATSYTGQLPFMSIKPNQLTIYFESAANKSKSMEIDFERKQPKNNNHKRGLSIKASKRVQNKIHWLLTFSKTKRIFNDYTNKYFNFKINFITLTLPTLQFHLDKTIKSKVFNQFLTELRQYHEVRNYVWRAECQSNGNIHFHIATDTYIPWFIIRRIWNRQLRKLGYIKAYQNKFKSMDFKTYQHYCNQNGVNDLSTIHARFQRGIKTNWLDPNTTDIHSVRKVKNMAAYLAKYIAKVTKAKKDTDRYDLKDRKIEGRNWGCSQSLSRCKSIVDWADTLADNLIDYAREHLKPYEVHDNYFHCYFFDFCALGGDLKLIINRLFLDYKDQIEYISGTIPNRKYFYN